LKFDHERWTKRLDQAIEKAWKEVTDSHECPLDIMGNYHDEKNLCCNRGFDELGQWYCRMGHVRALERQREANLWLSSMLEFYWQNGIESKAIEFLRETGFVTSYE
jgi:hypothetical protein